MNVPAAVSPSLEAAFAGPVGSEWAQPQPATIPRTEPPSAAAPVPAISLVEEFGPVYEGLIQSFRRRPMLPADSDRWDYLLD